MIIINNYKTPRYFTIEIIILQTQGLKNLSVKTYTMIRSIKNIEMYFENISTERGIIFEYPQDYQLVVFESKDLAKTYLNRQFEFIKENPPFINKPIKEILCPDIEEYISLQEIKEKYQWEIYIQNKLYTEERIG